MLSQGELLLRTQYKNWPRDLPVMLAHGTDDKVTSHQASQSFHDKIQVASKKIILFHGGYHELQNEPDGVKEKLLEEVVSFIDDRLASSTLEEAQAGSEPRAPETVNPADVAETAMAKM